MKTTTGIVMFTFNGHQLIVKPVKESAIRTKTTKIC